MVEDDDYIEIEGKDDEAEDEELEEMIEEDVCEPSDLFGILERRLDEINDSLKDIAMSLRKISGREGG